MTDKHSAGEQARIDRIANEACSGRAGEGFVEPWIEDLLDDAKREAKLAGELAMREAAAVRVKRGIHAYNCEWSEGCRCFNAELVGGIRNLPLTPDSAGVLERKLAEAKQLGYSEGMEDGLKKLERIKRSERAPLLTLLGKIWGLSRFSNIMAKKVRPAMVWIHEDDLRKLLTAHGFTAKGCSAQETGDLMPYELRDAEQAAIADGKGDA